MVRDVSTPEGVSWRVEIDWMARRIRNPFRRSLQVARDRIAQIRDERRERKAVAKRRREVEPEERKSGSPADCLDPLECIPADLEILAVIVLVVVAVVLIFFAVMWMAPIVWAILGVLVEFFFVTIAAVVILVWRTMLRRPWRVVARRVESEMGEVWAMEVVGYRTARRVVRLAADGLAQGRSPLQLGLAIRSGEVEDRDA
jgi:hypothetical protein